MCSCKPQLFYGTYVRAFRLFFAADAWGTVRPACVALDMLTARKTCGTLQAEARSNGKQAAVSRVPVEVWQLIHRAVIVIGLADAERSVPNFRCCAKWDDHASALRFGCANCLRCLGRDGMPSVNDKYINLVNDLLGDFGLFRPGQGLCSWETGWRNTSALIPVALPPNIDCGANETILHDDERRYDGAYRLAPTFFNVPKDPESPFVRFFHKFGLRSVDPDELQEFYIDVPWFAHSRAGIVQVPTPAPAVETVRRPEQVVDVGWQMWLCDQSCGR